MTTNLRIDGVRLSARLAALAAINPLSPTGSCRMALSDEDKAGRDLLVGWMHALGLDVRIDRVGNIFGVLEGSAPDLAPIMAGSHIDTVATGGRYDGALGVIGALEAVEAMIGAGLKPRRSVVVAAFSNEEGARYHPDMLGSLTYVGGMSLAEALGQDGIDGTTYGVELERIGYAGEMELGAIKPAAYLELHIEQGPVLDAEGLRIGVVDSLQGISWQEVVIEGQSNHAGTTPIGMRRDPGLLAAEANVFLRALAIEIGGGQVATVGRLELQPGLINVVPQRAVMTVDLRNPIDERLALAEARLAAFLAERSRVLGLTVSQREIARFAPVTFDAGIVGHIEQAAVGLGLSHRRMTSGAGHDAQMMSRICPAAMIFTPSVGGISHNPAEHTAPADLEAGANVLLATLLKLANDGAPA